jgi:putative ATP-grasp target RiPP
MIPADGRVPRGDERPSGPDSRPWILRFARAPDRRQAVPAAEAFYDHQQQIFLPVHGDLLPYMGTHHPTVVDGDPKNPPKLDEGAKD